MVHTLTDTGVRIVNTDKIINNALSDAILFEFWVLSYIIHTLEKIAQLLTTTSSTSNSSFFLFTMSSCVCEEVVAPL